MAPLRTAPDPPTPAVAAGARHLGWHLLIFAVGLAISALMVTRSQVTIDQFNLLARGWKLAFEGEWIPYGVWATGGGRHPGGATSLLVGLPLFAWEHHRAPVLLILASHVVAYLLLWSALRRILGSAELLLFAIIYWLSPWRLFFSGFLWNPNFLFVCGALHFFTAWRLRERAAFWPSLAHALGLGIAMQLHLSAFLLVVSSAVLWWRRYLRLHLGAVVAASALIGLSLAPWLLAMIEEPSLLPVSRSSLGHGLFALTPVLQGIVHWLRFAAVGVNRSMACLDFAGVGGPAMASIQELLPWFRLLLSAPTTLLAGWAHWRLWRRPGGLWRRYRDGDSARSWLYGVLRWSFLGALVVFGLSPVGVTGHGLLSIVHLAVLPVVLALGGLVAGRGSRALPAAVGAYAVLMVALGLALSVGSPAYRCGGPRCLTAHFSVPPLVADHRMFDDLGIRATCELVVGEPTGWWPDGLDAPSERVSQILSRRGTGPPTARPTDPPRSGRSR